MRLLLILFHFVLKAIFVGGRMTVHQDSTQLIHLLGGFGRTCFCQQLTRIQVKLIRQLEIVVSELFLALEIGAQSNLHALLAVLGLRPLILNPIFLMRLIRGIQGLCRLGG